MGVINKNSIYPYFMNKLIFIFLGFYDLSQNFCTALSLGLQRDGTAKNFSTKGDGL